jgi:hypothetical protein
LKTVVIGKSGTHNAAIDVDALLRTRMLVQANSGKGKSWLLRRLAEQLFGKVQVIIIDPEGEFATLREKYGYVLVGKGGETPADPRSAALVAQKLLELRASAVCDLYELKPATRHEWVQRFLDAMVDAPKNLWHPCVVIVDESHVYCPEKGAGESIASEAMIGLATRGRKRGFSCVFATQRLGKLRKDAAAELLNVMIGGTFIDIDRKRAADALGVYGKDQHKFFDDIKVLDRGSFYALGPAISDSRILIKVGPVETTHPEAGSAKHAAEPPPAPEKVQSMLPKLADLPKTAEDKARTEAELKREIRELKAQVRNAPAKTEQVRVADPKAIAKATAGLRALLGEAMKIIVKVTSTGFDNSSLKPEELKQALDHAAHEIAEYAKRKLKVRDAEFEKLKVEANRVLARLKKAMENENVTVELNVSRNDPVTVSPQPMGRPTAADLPTGDGTVTPKQVGILRAIAEFEAIGRKQISKAWIAARSGSSYTSSAYTNNLGALRSGGFIAYPGPDQVALTDRGRDAAGNIDVPTTSEEMLQSCLNILVPAQQKILKVLYEHRDGMRKDELASAVGASAASSAFTNNLGSMRSAGMIDYPVPGEAKIADWLFID